ncbi:MAG: exopolyphosphatase, partial [Thermicanus sp.]|nr:exopolyphosphatase [Thermicanus sp.]
MLKAVIDLGSNSVRLVVYQQGPHGTQKEIDNLKQVVRLSNHINREGRISEEGIRITVHVLRQFKQLCEAYEVEEIICVATQAVRIARNREELVERIYRETGIAVRILSGEEEARSGYLAVVNTIPLEEALTVDVGGGSTEITYFKDRKVMEKISIPYGGVNATKEFLEGDPPTSKEMKRLERTLLTELEKYPWTAGRRCPVIGMGGAARAVAKIHQAQRQYPLSILHAYQMWPYEVTGILELLRSTPLAKRKEMGGLSADRADIIIAGAAILDLVVRRAEANQFILSNKGLRDGILMEEVLKAKNEELLSDMLLHSIENNLDHFHMNRA